jgi:hypothetical protein
MLAVIRWASVLRPFAECLPMRSSILQSVVQVWFEIWNYSQHRYNLDENQFLDIYVIQSAYNVLLYPAII